MKLFGPISENANAITFQAFDVTYSSACIAQNLDLSSGSFYRSSIIYYWLNQPISLDNNHQVTSRSYGEMPAESEQDNFSLAYSGFEEDIPR